MLLRKIGLYINLRLITILRITKARNYWILGCTPEIWTNIQFYVLLLVLQFIYHSIWWCTCLVFFPSINRSHCTTVYHSTAFLSTVSSTLKVLQHGSVWVNFRFLTIWISLYSWQKSTSNSAIVRKLQLSEFEGGVYVVVMEKAGFGLPRM